MKNLRFSFWAWLRGDPKSAGKENKSKQISKSIANPTPFEIYDGRFTINPKVAYTIFGYGTLPQSQNAVHYLRIRPYMGAGDPAISEGVPNRQRFTRLILATCIAPENKAFWQALLGSNPTHVVRLGWVYLRTGEYVDLLYLPVNFSYPNHSPASLARAVGDQMVDQLKGERSPMLCPRPERMRAVQMFWASMIFLNWRWIVSDRYRISRENP